LIKRQNAYPINFIEKIKIRNIMNQYYYRILISLMISAFFSFYSFFLGLLSAFVLLSYFIFNQNKAIKKVIGKRSSIIVQTRSLLTRIDKKPGSDQKVINYGLIIFKKIVKL